jgi:hypothetical protein
MMIVNRHVLLDLVLELVLVLLKSMKEDLNPS